MAVCHVGGVISLGSWRKTGGLATAKDALAVNWEDPHSSCTIRTPGTDAGLCHNITTEIPMRLVLSALSLTALAFTSALGGARQDAKVLMPSDPASLKIEQDWGFSDAIVTGDTIYLSGVVAGVREGETDLRLGYTRAFERIAESLKNAGATWDDVVEITSFHTDLTTQMPAIVAVKKNYVKPPYPAWTAIQVSRLIPSNGITEIKIVAKLRRN
jgi:enamine deaminase RidA (YjgF/YER057c/UK114 family)